MGGRVISRKTRRRAHAAAGIEVDRSHRARLKHAVVACLTTTLLAGALLSACTATSLLEAVRVHVSRVVGNRGPAGGVVFYDKGSFSDGWQYLEAAPNDQATTYIWGPSAPTTGAAGTVIGSGDANTTAIVDALGAGDYAARLCSFLVLGGYSDWFLPSKDELNEMYLQRTAIGDFASGSYWSSSEDDSLDAWNQSFDDGYQSGSSKNSTRRVRAVRAF